MFQIELSLYFLAGLFLGGVMLRMALDYVYGARGPDQDDVSYPLGKLISWIIIASALAPIILVGLVMIVGFVVLFICIVSFVETILARRQTLREMNSGLLALVTEDEGSLQAAVLEAGTQDQGIVGWATSGLVAMLKEGEPLSEAIQQHPRALPREAVAFAAAGEKIHAESAALRELARPRDHGLTSLWRSCVDRSLYILVVILWMSGVFAFMAFRIVPEFQKIFAEFDLQLPALTGWVLEGSSIVVAYFMSGALLVILAAAIWGGFLLAIFYLADKPILQPLADFFFRDLKTAPLMRILAVTAEARGSMASVVERLSEVYPVAWIRRALQKVDREIYSGSDWRDALLKARLLRAADHALLGTAQEVGNLPWALRLIANRGERSIVYKLSTITQIVYPIVLIALGAAVGVFVVAMFLPLVALIQGLT